MNYFLVSMSKRISSLEYSPWKRNTFLREFLYTSANVDLTEVNLSVNANRDTISYFSDRNCNDYIRGMSYLPSIASKGIAPCLLFGCHGFSWYIFIRL